MSIAKSIDVDSRFMNISRWQLVIIGYDMVQAVDHKKRLNLVFWLWKFVYIDVL